MRTPWAWVATSLVVAACAGSEPDSNAPDGGGGADAGADVHVMEDGSLCWSDQKWCGSCVAQSDPDYGCGDASCDPCLVPNATPICESGKCSVGACTAGYADCNAQSLDGCEISTNTNHDHCGSCAKACGTTEVCLSGSCASNCGALTNCTGSCVDTSSDPQHCGSCTTACSPGQTCQAGSCACTSGLTNCAGSCVDTTSSKQNCGTCGKACVDPANGVAACTAGQCVLACFGGFTSCGTGCTDTTSSSANCGGCGKACGSNQTCQSGLCVATYHAATDFSSVQGQAGWSYLNGDGSPMVFDSTNNWWQGTEQYVLLWANGGHPGNAMDSMRRWTAPQAGTGKITGNAHDGHVGCGTDGVNVSIRIGSNVLWQSTIALDDAVGADFDITTTVAVGDKVDFVINKGIDNGCDSTFFDPTIVLSYKLP
jgi:hypothetical protein